jgi:hypothetical protein
MPSDDDRAWARIAAEEHRPASRRRGRRIKKWARAEEAETDAIEARANGETQAAEELDAEANELRDEARKLAEEVQKHQHEEDPWAELNEKQPLEGGLYEHCSVLTPCRFSFSALEPSEKSKVIEKVPLVPGKKYMIEFKANEEQGEEGNGLRVMEVDTLP